MVVEVHHVYGEPLILVFAFGELHDFAQGAPAEGRFGVLAELVACVAAFAGARAELVARALVTSGRGTLARVKGWYMVVRRSEIASWRG